MKKLILFLSLLPLCLTAQEYHNSTPFKAIEAKFKIDKRYVVWHLYAEQTFPNDSLCKLIAFPLEKKAGAAYDAYIVRYNTQKQRIENYYIAPNYWQNTGTQRIQGIEISKRTLQLKPKAFAYELRTFYSNLSRQQPVGSEQLLWLLPDGKKLKPVFTANALSYQGNISIGGNTPCKGETTEVRSTFTITPQKARGYYVIDEQRHTQQITITANTQGICTDNVTTSTHETFRWQYSRRFKGFKCDVSFYDMSLSQVDCQN